MATTIDTLQVKFEAEGNEFNTSMNTMFGPGSTLARLGGIAAGAVAAAGAAVTGFAATAIAAGTEFETHMTSAFRAVDDISSEMEEDLIAGVRRIATETGISAEEVARALASYSWSGMETAEALEILEIAAKGSVSAGSDLVDTIGKLSGVEAGFRGQGVELIEVMDSLTTLSNNASGGFNALTDALVTVTPQANAAGITINEVGAAVGALTWLGVPANEAATQIRQALTELNDSSRGAGEAFNDLVGVSFKEFIAAGGTFEEAIAAMNAALQEQNEELGENVTIGQLFGSTIAGGAIEMLSAGEGADFYATVLESLEESAGSTEAGFEKMRGTVQAQNDQLGANFRELQLTAAQHLMPIWSDVLTAVNNAMPAVQEVVDRVFGAIAGAVSWLVERFTNFRTEQSGIWDAVTAAVEAAKGALGSAFEFLATLWTDVLKPVWDEISPAVGNIWTAVTGIVEGAFKAIEGVFETFIGLLTGDWDRAWEGVKTLLEGVWDAVTSAIEGAWNQIKVVLNAIIAVVEGALTKAWENYGGLMRKVWDAISSTVSDKWNQVQAALAAARAWLVDTFSPIWDALQATVETVWSAIQTAITTAWHAVEALLDTAITWVAGAFTSAWEALQATLEGIWEAITTLINDEWGNIKGHLDAAMDFISGLFTDTWEALKTALTNLWADITSVIEEQWAAIKGVLDAVMEFLTSVFEPGWESTQEALTGIWDAIENLISTTWENIKVLLNAAVDYLRTVFEPAWGALETFFTDLWDNVEDTFRRIWGSIIEWLTNTWNALTGVAETAWGAVVEAILGVFDGLVSTLEGVWNGVVDTVRNAVNAAISMINNVIEMWNGISFGVPSETFEVWNPFGDNWTISTPEINVTVPQIPTIPLLAEGGIVDEATLAIIGEAGPEAVIPLDQLDEFTGSGGEPAGDQTIIVELDSRTLLRALAPRLVDEIRIKTGLVGL